MDRPRLSAISMHALSERFMTTLHQGVPELLTDDIDGIELPYLRQL